MKRIIYSDLHLHTWNYGATVQDGYNSRLFHQYETLREMTRYAVENDIKYVYFCGDLFHKAGSIPTQALQLAHNAFRGMKMEGLQLRFLVGNHDVEDKKGFIHALTWLDSFGIVAMGNAPTLCVDNDLPVMMLGYTQDEDLLRQTLDDVQDGSMLLLHQGVDGQKLGSGYVLNDILTAGMIKPGIRHCFTGHYHTTAYVADNLTVVGSMCPLTWSDVNEPKGFMVWDDETNKVTKCCSELPPKFVSIVATEPTVPTVRDLNNCFVRVIGNPDMPLEKARKLVQDRGAITCEFHLTPEDEAKADERRQFKLYDIEEGVKQVEEEVLPPRRVVGQSLREMDYVTPDKLKEFN